jgi:hypothetical protein
VKSAKEKLMDETSLEKCWKLLNGVLVLLKEVQTDEKNRRLKMAERDVGLVKHMLALALDEMRKK